MEDDKDALFGGDDEFGENEVDFSEPGGAHDEFSELEHDFDSEVESLQDDGETTVSPAKEEVSESAVEDGQGPSEPPTGSSEPSAEPPTEPVEPPKPPKTIKPAKRQPMSKRKKAIGVMLRRAGLDEVPPLDELMKGKSGQKMRIGDIALFIEEPEDETLKWVYEKCPLKNLVNLSAKVSRTRVITVGAQVLNAMRMFQPIQVVKILQPTGEASVQCSSGRHRLAFLVLVYGADVEIPVYVEEMTLNEARDAVVVANQCRPTKALEKAEHAVLRAVSGNADARQDEIYRRMVKTKALSQKYCTYSVVERKHPAALTFPVTKGSTRKGNDITTVNNLEGIWGTGLAWDVETKKKSFDASLRQLVSFLNEMVKIMRVCEGFDPSHHMAAMTLKAIGKWYRNSTEVTGGIPDSERVAKAVVGLGEVGRQKAEATYQQLSKALRE